MVFRDLSKSKKPLQSCRLRKYGWAYVVTDFPCKL